MSNWNQLILFHSNPIFISLLYTHHTFMMPFYHFNHTIPSIQHQILTTPVSIDVLPVSSVCDLGVYLDADLTITAHINHQSLFNFVALH